MLLVTNKVVIYKKDALAPTQSVEAVQLGDNLRGSLGARTMTQQGGHIAEVTIEGTTARELDADGVVMLEIRQSPKRDRGLVDIGKFIRYVYASSPTPDIRATVATCWAT